MNFFGLDLGSTDLWLLAAAGACLAWLIPHRLAVSRERRNAFRTASIKFRSAILTAFTGLYPIPSNWPKDKIQIIDILEKLFPHLQASVTEFREQLPLQKRWLFDRAWRLYRLGGGKHGDDGQYYWQYVPLTGEGIVRCGSTKHDNRLSYLSDFRINIDGLLSFASDT